MVELFPLEMQYCERVAEISKKYLPEAWSYAAICDVLKYDNNIYYVAKDTNTDIVVGFAGILIVADEAELLNIAVSSDYRRNGIAKRLLEHLIAVARKQGAYRMLLEVRSSNEGAKVLYNQIGFSELAIRKNYYSGPTEDAIIMEKLL